MSFTFEALPARYGDSLFLTFREPARTLRLLIDAGPANVYRAAVRPRLEREKQASGGELTLDAVMVSHIDEDHILGLLDLLSELQDADQRQQPRPYDVRWLLHNSFDALLAEGEGGAARALGGQTVLAGLGGAEALIGPGGEPLGHTAELVLASYSQGSRLASLAAALKITRNPPDGSPIMSVAEPRVLKLGEATLTIVGPREKELTRLREEWRKWRAKQAAKPPASLVALLDESVPNLSSIVALLEYQGARVLLTGDARSDYIHAGLKAAGLTDAAGRMKVDVLKLPHHGSVRNITLDFLKKVTARHYVASGDGTYGNPDRETLELIEKARPRGDYDVHLTYSAADCDHTHEAWRRGRKGPAYDPLTDGIVPVVERWRATGKIRVHEGPVSIALVP